MSTEMNQKKECPLNRALPCAKEACAWYDSELKRCAVLSIQESLDFLLRIATTAPYPLTGDAQFGTEKL